MLRRHRNNEAKRRSTGGPVPQPDLTTGRPRAHAVADERPLTSAPARAERRLEPAAEDHAMYSCECGFIFKATVSTSVGCPHCGGSQAW